MPSSKPRQNPVSIVRWTALVEGVSFLVLLGIAMPLKYLADQPAAVTYTGWVHGALFVALCGMLPWVMIKAGWHWTRAALIVIAALVPFGPFILDPRVRRWESEFSGTPTAPPGKAESPPK